MRKSKATWLFFWVGLSRLITYQASAQSIEPFKYMAVALQLATMVITIKYLRLYRSNINWRRATTFITFLSIYPLCYILLTCVSSFEFKKITDGLFLYAPYYQLPLVALAVATSLRIEKITISLVIKQYLVLIFPIMLIGIFIGNFQLFAVAGTDSYILYNNFAIPAATLLLFRPNTREKLLTLGICFLMLISVMLGGSRSYLLVIFFYSFFLILLLSPNRLLLAGAVMIIIAFVLNALSTSLVGYVTSGSEQLKLLNKLDTEESLSEVLYTVIQTGDFSALYYWEGNSRAQILIDAFNDFSLTDIIFGRSTFGIYESFVSRNTIEIGWAQEAFWFGFIYVGIKFILIFFSWRWLKKQYKKNNNSYLYFLQSIIVIRFLDGWFYGMPTFDVYNLIFFLALMSCCIKNTQSVAGNQSFLVSYTTPQNNSINNRIVKLMQDKD